jgi:cholesterol transport system auxiliary component
MMMTGEMIMGRRQYIRKLAQAAGIIAPLLLLGGCVSFGVSKAPVRLIGLTAETSAPAGLTATARAGEALVVYEPQADRSLSVLRVPVQVDDSTIAYLKDATWVERPARLMRSLLAETIRAKGKRLVFEDDQPEARGTLRLTGRLIAMGYDGRSRSVVVRLDAMRQGADGTTTMRRFEAVEKDVAPKGGAVATALNHAANAVAGQVADWVN